MKQTELPVAPDTALTVHEPSVGEMLKAVVDKGVTHDNVAAIDKLVTLYERMQDRNAEKQFTAAFVKLQTELPTIVASTVIPNRGKYERFEDIMRQIAGPLAANQFTVSFTQDFKENRIVQTCHLSHVGGHTRTNSFAVRVGKGDSDTQADCKASTTAKRNALLNALNIVIRQDVFQDEDDPRVDGAPIDEAEAMVLHSRVIELNCDEPKFLKYAGVPDHGNPPTLADYKRIAESRLDECHAMLDRKGRR